MNRIPRGFLVPSSAYTLQSKHIHGYIPWVGRPQVGDVLYGRVERLGAHGELENRSGRIHRIADGSLAVFVLGNRYATDAYESVIPERTSRAVDLVARSGIVGEVRTTRSRFGDPTRIEVLGRVVTRDGEPTNTLDHPLITANRTEKKRSRSKLILVVGTAMNAGKSTAAVACCRALASSGSAVRASKVSGTASLKDILHMNDAGATVFNDFSHFGYPSTYLLPESDLLGIFNTLDLRYANNPQNYWVVEMADGILQRETAMLLAHQDVTSRIHRLVLCASDTFGALGGLGILDEKFGLKPHAISGLVSGSPLGVRELSAQTDVPVFDSADPQLAELSALLR